MQEATNNAIAENSRENLKEMNLFMELKRNVNGIIALKYLGRLIRVVYN